MKIIIAPDSYKGCLSSREVAASMGEALSEHECTLLPLSDGGEGMLDTFLQAMQGKRIPILLHDPLMRWTEAAYGIAGDTAIIEIAQAVGLHLIEPGQRNPMKATSYGVGEIIRAAYRQGIRKFIVGLGGSGTSDCGIGMLKALGESKNGEPKLWESIRKDCEFCLASDVTNPLCGTEGAAYVFAPQKGADMEMVKMLDERARRFAQACTRHFGTDHQYDCGAGAAGGLGYAFLQFFHATFHSGAELLLEMVHFDELLKEADLVITGEGHSDRQTLMGKLPGIVLQHAQRHHIPTWLISGAVSDKELLQQAGFNRILPVTPASQPLEEAMLPDVAKRNIKKALREA